MLFLGHSLVVCSMDSFCRRYCMKSAFSLFFSVIGLLALTICSPVPAVGVVFLSMYILHVFSNILLFSVFLILSMHIGICRILLMFFPTWVPVVALVLLGSFLHLLSGSCYPDLAFPVLYSSISPSCFIQLMLLLYRSLIISCGAFLLSSV